MVVSCFPKKSSEEKESGVNPMIDINRISMAHRVLRKLSINRDPL